jgi:hypothetical protein
MSKHTFDPDDAVDFDYLRSMYRAEDVSDVINRIWDEHGIDVDVDDTGIEVDGVRMEFGTFDTDMLAEALEHAARRDEPSDPPDPRDDPPRYYGQADGYLDSPI